MKVRRINDYLRSDHIVPVLFGLPPIRLPVSSTGEIVPEEQAEGVHYSAFIYLIDEKEFVLFEFPQYIYDGLMAYRARHNKVSNIEVLLSREADDQSIRMVSGREVIYSPISEQEKKIIKKHYDKLYSKYLSKKGYAVGDFRC